MQTIHLSELQDPIKFAATHHLPDLECDPEERPEAEAARLSVLSVILAWFLDAPSQERLDVASFALTIRDPRRFAALAWRHEVDMIRELESRYARHNSTSTLPAHD